MGKAQRKESPIAAFINDMDRRFCKEDINKEYVDARRELRLNHKALIASHGRHALNKDWDIARLKTGIASVAIGGGIGGGILVLFASGRILYGWI